MLTPPPDTFGPALPPPPPPVSHTIPGIQIDPTGEVFFLLQNSAELHLSRHVLRVSKKIMVSASPNYVKTMILGVSAQQQAASGPPFPIVIAPAREDPDAVRHLCLLLHRRPLNRQLSIRQLVELVSTARNWSCLCTDILLRLEGMVAQKWRECQGRENRMSYHDLYFILVVAYSINNAQYFCDISAALMSRFEQLQIAPHVAMPSSNLASVEMAPLARRLMRDHVAVLLRDGATKHRENLVQDLREFSSYLRHEVPVTPSRTDSASSAPVFQARELAGKLDGSIAQHVTDRTISIATLLSKIRHGFGMERSSAKDRRERDALAKDLLEEKAEIRYETHCKLRLLSIVERYEAMKGLCLQCAARGGAVEKGQCAGLGWHTGWWEGEGSWIR